jgi:hypothetical protein
MIALSVRIPHGVVFNHNRLLRLTPLHRRDIGGGIVLQSVAYYFG